MLGRELAHRGVPLLIAGLESAANIEAARAAGAVLLPTVAAAAEIGPILLVQSAYKLIATLAMRRGFDPDRPAHLRKVTETV